MVVCVISEITNTTKTTIQYKRYVIIRSSTRLVEYATRRLRNDTKIFR